MTASTRIASTSLASASRLWPCLALAAVTFACKTNESTLNTRARPASSASAPKAPASSTAKVATPPPNPATSAPQVVAPGTAPTAAPDAAPTATPTAPPTPAAEPAPALRIPAKAELGRPAPDFTLKDLDGKEIRLADFQGKTVVLEWFTPMCPYCIYAHGEGPLKEMPERLTRQGIVWLGINSDGPKEKGGSPEEIREFAAMHGLRTPILLDPDGTVGKLYGARTTPHVFVINDKGLLVYRGALDNAPFGKVEDDAAAKANYVEAAIADIAAGHSVMQSDTQPYGCRVRYAKP